jgi:predicted dehydrogenase
MNGLRIAVIGAGSFGRHHVRVLSQLAEVQLVGVVDQEIERAQLLARGLDVRAFQDPEDVLGAIDAAIVATPTNTHEAVASRLLRTGVDVLVEKPIADSVIAAERLTRLAQAQGRVLQVGHLERFNPAVLALERAMTIPLFFEVHRLSVFSQRSLDVDVVLDLMIHDLDIVLHLTQEVPHEIRAAGISVLSPRVDIANVRLAFASGCVANLTASRVSTERVRKLRLFQPHQYISLDYARQDATLVSVQIPDGSGTDGAVGPSGHIQPEIAFSSLPTEKEEPLQLELASFVRAVRERRPPAVDGLQATNALRVAESIVAKIKEHGELVKQSVRRSMKIEQPL